MSSLQFEAHIDISQIRRELAEMEARFQRTTQSASSSGQEMDATFKKIGAAMAGYFTLTAAKGFLDQVIAVRGEFQQLDIALQTMLGNKEQADKLMANVVQLAAKTPFSLTELGQGAKQLLAFKTPAEQIPDTLRRIGDVAAGVSVPVGDLISAYGKVSAKGKMQAEELNQFAERGVPIISELAKVIGTTDDAIYKMAEQGKIGFGELQQAIVNMTNEGGQFANMMEKQAESLTGQLSNLGDAWDRMLNDVGTSSQGMISGGISGLTSLVENYEVVLKILGLIITAYGTYKGAIVAVAMAEKAKLVATQVQEYIKMARALGVATANQIAFNRATLINPYVAVATAITGLVAAMIFLNKTTKESIGVSADFKRNLDDELKSVEGNFKALKGTAEGTEARRIAIENINSKYGEYLGNLLTEKSSLEDIQKAQEAATVAIAKNMALKSQEKELTSYKDAVKEAEESYSKSLKKIFDKTSASSAAKGAASAAIDAYIEELSKTNIGAGARFDFESIWGKLGQNGINIAGSDRAVIDLGYAVTETINARQSEQKAMEDLNATYDAYLKKIGIIDKTEPPKVEDGKTGGEDKDNAYDGDKYRKTLAEQKKAYDDYVEAMKNARPEDEKALEKYYANLKKQGDDYKAYLNKQLQVHKGNVDATAAIYQAAAKGGVILNGKEDFKSMSGNTDTSKVKVTDIKRSAAVPLEFKKLADYSEKAKLNAEKLRKEMGMLSKAEIGAGLIEGANAMSEMARYAGQMDEELGKALQSTADIVGNVGNVVAGMASGDYLGAAVGAVGVMATVSSLFDDSAAKQAEAARRAENTRQQYELQNRALEYQIELMNTLSGTDRTQAQVDTQNLIEEQIANLDAKAKATQIKFGELGQYQVSVKGAEDLIRLMEGRGKYNTEDLTGSNMFAIGINQIKKNIDEYNSVEQMVNHGLNVKNLEDIQNLIDEYTAKKKQLAEFYEEASGTTTDAITDSIVEGFRNGQSAADSLAEHTKDSMKNALIESFKNTYVTAAAANIVTKIGEAMTDGLVTQDEQDDINAATQTAAEAAEKGMKIYTDAFRNMYGEDLFSSDTDSTESGLAGGIRKEMTEETASRLAGLFNVMSLDTRSIRDNMQLNLANNVQQLNQMIAIELNTGRTAVATEATVAALNNAITELRSIKTNTSNNRRGEG
ncbi:tape measure domain-containing protein [Breznakibacter xylanolyticus]|uniref:Tape measure domain-containing protein n=1 Tax=Breznakibacter xylanolyticus TaxID=990 RepID=A0A2W7NF49_9BACT|nr:tape measure protein [Breznakibacter xylanolyticus]PZX18113.1 tape measure domain-containing protein [Breznakibacter xylanolyticus]